MYLPLRAEYQLDVIGAGATARSEQDWHEIWNNSPERKQALKEIEVIHAEGRARPPVEITVRSEFATPWGSQAWELVKRGALDNWRDPNYILAKLSLNAVGGLFIGFTFWRSKDTQQRFSKQAFRA